MVALADTGVAQESDSITAGTPKETSGRTSHTHNPNLISNPSSSASLATAPRLMDVPEGEVVQLDEPFRTPISPRHRGDQDVPFPMGREHMDDVEIVASPESMGSFPSPGAYPPYPTASSSTALYQNHPLGINTAINGMNTASRPSTSRRPSNASSIPSNVFHSPRIAPASPGSPAISRAPSRAPSLGSHHALSAGLDGRSRSLSNRSTSASSASGQNSGNLSRRSSAAGNPSPVGGWRLSFSGGQRVRPPSTLIPAPGHEAETIPPSSENSGSIHQETVKGTLLPSLSLKDNMKGHIVIKDFAYPDTDDRFIGAYPSSADSRAPSRASSEAGDSFFSGLPSGLGRSGSRGGGSGKRRKSSFGGWAGFFGGWGRNRDSSQSSGLGLGNLTKVDTEVDLSSDLTPSSSFVDEDKSPLIGIDKSRDENGERHHHDVWEDDVSGEGDVEGEE